ncbi:hypothetical protein K1719_003946 [Acacia pycnantha]|nr:hypothetical protein K1719_003946 [Acacia pycnantha]
MGVNYYKIIDPQKRAIYDQYGEEGLKGQVPPPDADGASFFHTGKGPTTFRFNPRNVDDIFAEFFGFSSRFGGIGFRDRSPRALWNLDDLIPQTYDTN